MFGISSKIAIGLGIALLVVAGAFAWYFNWSQDRMVIMAESIATEKSNVIRLESAIDVQKQTITMLEESRENDQQAVLQLSAENQTYKAEVSDLRKKFAKHNLDRLSLAKPGLIERIINKGTKKVFQEFEEITDPRGEVE